MDPILQKALDFSQYRYSLSTQRKNLKEQMNAKLVYATNGGVFKVDRPLIVFVQMLLDQGRESSVLLDNNDNPIMINDLSKFREEIFDRYFSATLEYQEKFEKLKQKRSVKSLIADDE
jgi:hypothetical protein